VARANLEIYSESKGLLGKIVDCNLILQKDRGLFVKWQGFSSSDLFSIGKCGLLSPPLMNRWQRWSTVNRVHGRPKISPELGLATAPGRGGLLQPRGNGEGAMGIWFWSSPELG
jgi:hypothetical protein